MQYQEYQLDAKALSADSLLLHSLLTGLLGALLLLRPHLMSNLFRWPFSLEGNRKCATSGSC